MTVDTCFPGSLGKPACSSQGPRGVISGKASGEESSSRGLRTQIPLPIHHLEKCVCVPFSVPLPHHHPRHSSLGQGEASRHKALCVWGGMCTPPSTQRTQCSFYSLQSAPYHHLSTAHARLQLVTGSGQPPHTGALGDFKQVPGIPCSVPDPPLS